MPSGVMTRRPPRRERSELAEARRIALVASSLALFGLIASIFEKPDLSASSYGTGLVTMIGLIGSVYGLLALRDKFAQLTRSGHAKWLVLAALGTLLWAAVWTWQGDPLPIVLVDALALGLPLVGLAVAQAWLAASASGRTPWQQLGGMTRVGAAGTLSGALPLLLGIMLTALSILISSRMGAGAAQGLLPSTLGGIEIVFSLGLGLSGLIIVKRLLDRRSERSDLQIAAHLHDSVLQQLAVIQRQADDPDAVRTTARTTERDLRDWLSGRSIRTARMLSDALRSTTRTVEDEHPGAVVELVTAGDLWATGRIAPVVDATQEALRNAARHGGGSAQVFAEVTADGALTVYIRDTGPGFDLGAVPADRGGIRDAIIGRMRDAGGSATIESTAEGTEVTLRLPAVDA